MSDLRVTPGTVCPPGAEVLVVRFRSLGDIMLSLPLAAAIHSARPDVKLDFLIDESYAGLAAAFPFIRRELTRGRRWSSRFRNAFAMARSYDLAIDLHGTNAAALTARAASRGNVAGYAGKRMDFLYSLRLPAPSSEVHTTDGHMGFLSLLGLPPAAGNLELGPEDVLTKKWREKLGGRGVILHPGARFPHKMWPGERFRDVGRDLRSRGFAVHVLAGPEDIPLPELAEFPLLSENRPARLLAALRAFRLFIGNDSGPMHLAAAAGCAVVALFGPSDRARWSPRSERARVLSCACACGAGSRPPCRHPGEWCMEKISVEEVLRAVEELAGGN